MTPENQRDEEEVIKEAKKHSQELPPHKASQKYRINSLLKIILDYQEQRQSWEREKKELINYRDACELKNYAIDALTAESGSFKESWEIGIKEIAQLRAEKKGLEERVKYLEKFLPTAADFEDQEAELTRLKSRNEELEAELQATRKACDQAHQNTLDRDEEIDRLKAENAELRRDLLMQREDACYLLRKEISLLTASLARAHEALEPFATLTEYDVMSAPVAVGWLTNARKALSDPTGQLAFEKWKAMEAVVEAARYLVKELEAPHQSIAHLVDTDDNAGQYLREALEALDAKGGVSEDS